jgi:pantetheine-phosphate adenylyltransferase
MGHIDIIRRAGTLFDRVLVAVGQSSHKSPMFSTEERVEFVRSSISDLPDVSVEPFDGLLMEFAESRDAVAVIRGLRAVSDFEYEFQMALMNRCLSARVETVFLMPSEQYTYLNSSIVREIAQFGGDISRFVPPEVARQLADKHPS